MAWFAMHGAIALPASSALPVVGNVSEAITTAARSPQRDHSQELLEGEAASLHLAVRRSRRLRDRL